MTITAELWNCKNETNRTKVSPSLSLLLRGGANGCIIALTIADHCSRTYDPRTMKVSCKQASSGRARNPFRQTLSSLRTSSWDGRSLQGLPEVAANAYALPCPMVVSSAAEVHRGRPYIVQCLFWRTALAFVCLLGADVQYLLLSAQNVQRRPRAVSRCLASRHHVERIQEAMVQTSCLISG